MYVSYQYFHNHAPGERYANHSSSLYVIPLHISLFYVSNHPLINITFYTFLLLKKCNGKKDLRFILIQRIM